jgi:excisionase family DNA binding protein
LNKNQDEIYPLYFTTGVVARLCGVSKVTVLRWIEKGNLAAFKLPGGQNRIHRDDFFSFARKHGIPLRREPQP